VFVATHLEKIKVDCCLCEMLVVVLLLCVVTLVNARRQPLSIDIDSVIVSSISPSCPCSNHALCSPVSIPIGSRKELFSFVDYNTPVTQWSLFNFTQLTTLAVFNRVAGAPPAPFLCVAHSHHVRIVHLVAIGAAALLNATVTAAWQVAVIADCRNAFCDGLNIDIEDPIVANSPESHALSALTRSVCDALHRWSPHASCSFDVAWSAHDIDGRAYDYVALANATDLLFEMVYDTRSQLTLAQCVAGANTPTSALVTGFKSYRALGIAPSKLIVGLPWYGYLYPCLPGHRFNDPSPCKITPVPFRGAPCSDASGSEQAYDTIMSYLTSGLNTTAVQFDASTESMMFNLNISNQVHQVWFDDPRTLAFKCGLARALGVSGVGVWTIDMTLDHDMWEAFDAFLR
jgi:di-N-acetylchitobiase